MKIYEAPRVPEGQSSADNSVVATARRELWLVAMQLASLPQWVALALVIQAYHLTYVQLSDFDYVKAIDFRSIYGVKKMSPSTLRTLVLLLFQLTQQRIHKEKIK